jgi:glycerophosphoryl diester phosphodiesterase
VKTVIFSNGRFFAVRFFLGGLGLGLASALDLCATPLIVAHRGASKDAPGNTIAAFELAWKQGADAIEADFRLTRDQRIVCIHDPYIQDRDGETLMIREATLDGLRGLDVGRSFGKRWKGTSN